jgi:predicted secreted protein
VFEPYNMRHRELLAQFSMTSHSRKPTTKKSKDMITQNELIQKSVAFWKTYFLEQSRHELNMIIGLAKSMSQNAYTNNGENDDTGLYHSSLLAEKLLQDFSENTLEATIDHIVHFLIEDILKSLEEKV